MIKINAKTKKAQGIIKRYALSQARELSDVYTSYSRYKEIVYKEILFDMQLYKGYDLRITGFNSQFFTVAFQGVYHNKECLFYITPSYMYFIEKPV